MFVDYWLSNQDSQFFQVSTAVPSGLKKRMWTSFFRVGRLQKTIWISESMAFVDFQPSNAGFRIQNSSILVPWYFLCWKGKHLLCESAVSGNQKLLQTENSQTKTLSKRTSQNLSGYKDINTGIYENFYQILAFVDYWLSNAGMRILSLPLKYSEFFWHEKKVKTFIPNRQLRETNTLPQIEKLSNKTLMEASESKAIKNYGWKYKEYEKLLSFNGSCGL